MRLSAPITRDLLLIGGGHAHAIALRRWGMAPLPGARVTLVNPDPSVLYTGMLPGYVAGHYAWDDLAIDLVKLARFAGKYGVRRTAGSAGDHRNTGSRRLEVHDAEPLDVQPTASCSARHRENLARVIMRGQLGPWH